MKASYTCKFDLQQDSIMHLHVSMLVWRGVEADKGQGFDQESQPVVGTFDNNCQVLRMWTFEFPLIMDAILD